MDEDEIDWLYQATSGDVYRITNEVDKIKLFPSSSEQKQVLNELRFSPESDLYAVSIYDVADALIRNNKAFVLDYLRHEENGFDLMSIVGMTLQKVKNIILLTQNSGKTATEIGLQDKAGWAIKKAYSGFPVARLQYLLQFLSGIDLKLKMGLLDMSKEAQIDYLMTNLIF